MHCFRQVLVALLLSLSLAACGGPRADIVISDSGCNTSHFVLEPDREPAISLENRTASPMVFTIPQMVRFVTVAPGSTAEFELPRYIMGSFEFFCLDEAEHLALSGGNPFLCAVEPAKVAPVARSGGIFEIVAHDRIKEITGAAP